MRLLVQIKEAKRFVSAYVKKPNRRVLETLETELRQAFLRAVGELVGDISKETRILHLAGRKRWAIAKKENPSLTPLEHIDTVYPDRRKLKMVRRDLADLRIDPKLYQALADWLRQRPGRPRNMLPRDFGLPTKTEATDTVVQSPEYQRTVSVISKLGTKDGKIVRARNAMRARRHRKNLSKRRRPIEMLAAE